VPSKAYTATKSSLFANSSSGTDLGGGKDTHLSVGGGYSGYDFRGAVDFGTIDWSDIANLTKATLRLYVSSGSGMHGSKSSSADISVRRITSSWTANSASSSGDSPSGSGWTTSPTTWPGPSTTSTDAVTKSNIPTGSGTAVDIDVTALVRQWAPVTSVGGGGQTKYGLALHSVSSYAEFWSAHGSTDPRLTLEYTSNPPNVPTLTKPTGKSGDTTPAYEFTATHPDGASITQWDLEDRPAGGSVTYSKYAQTSGIASGKVTHSATTALSLGPREYRARVYGGGLWSAWSGWGPYAIDRPPATPVMTAPTGTISGSRRPVHTFTWSDPDADPGEVYDVEVYQDAGGGVPAGGTVGGTVGKAVTGGTSPTSWTPTADLPGGPLLARARVRTAGVYSAWSAYRPYTIVLTTPTIIWNRPPYDGAFAFPRASDWADPARVLTNMAMETFSTTTTPPAGQTITTARYKVEVSDPGIGGPAVGTVLTDSNQATTGYAYAFRPDVAPGSTAWLSGTVKVTATITASGGGVATEVRYVRFTLGECAPALALGDAVTDLAVTYTPKGDDAVVAIRAQTSPTAAVAGQTWRAVSDAALVQAALPATNAYLGVRSRIARRVDDTQLMLNPSFESGQANWGPNGSHQHLVSIVTDTNAPDGDNVLRITGDGVVGYPAVTQQVDAIPGATYKLSGFARIGGVKGATIRVDMIGPTGSNLGVGAYAINATLSTTFVYGEAWYTVPTDGSVSALRVYLLLIQVPVSTDAGRFDRVYLHGPQLGDGGLDVLQASWKSLG